MTVSRWLGRMWPRNLTGRTIALLLGSLTLFHLGSLWMHHHELRDRDAITSTTVMAVGIIAAAVMLARWLTGPLRRIAQAADSIGRGGAVTVPQDGPEEVQRVARALNAMQSRITRLMDDRTQALAAVSHDLRTPLTRMRLRAGFLDDPDMRARMEADLDEMEGMIAATLAYLQGGTETEPPALTDIGAMLSTLCDAANDAITEGCGAVTFSGPAHLDAVCRPVALRRAVANLIGNAVSYAGGGAITLRSTVNGLQIAVADRGPGIPDGELERVFEPFHRLEASRNRATGGVGLGLTIALQSVVEQGGGLVLANRPGGGLNAVITLPIVAAQTHPTADKRLDLPMWEAATSTVSGHLAHPT